MKLSARSSLSLRWLRQVLLEHPRAAAVLLILDGCYSDVLSSSAPAPSFETLRQRLASSFAGTASPVRQEGIRLVLTAGGRDLAQERAGHGVLTSTLLAALRGERAEIIDTEGQLIFSRLFGWLSEVLRQEARCSGSSATGPIWCWGAIRSWRGSHSEDRSIQGSKHWRKRSCRSQKSIQISS